MRQQLLGVLMLFKQQLQWLIEKGHSCTVFTLLNIVWSNSQSVPLAYKSHWSQTLLISRVWSGRLLGIAVTVVIAGILAYIKSHIVAFLAISTRTAMVWAKKHNCNYLQEHLTTGAWTGWINDGKTENWTRCSEPHCRQVYAQFDKRTHKYHPSDWSESPIAGKRD